MMQQIVSRISAMATSRLGEKFLYVTQSLRRRHSQFIPLLVILSLTMTTTTMLLIESGTVGATAANELQYAYGSDIRIAAETSQHYHDFNDHLEEYDWIIRSTPVIEVPSGVSNLPFKLEGIIPLEYANVCRVDENSFNYGDALEVLARLSSVHQGIILSEYIGSLLNRSIGDRIALNVRNGDYTRMEGFTIVGFMKTAPGFGYASETEADPTSLPWQCQYGVKGTVYNPGLTEYRSYIGGSDNDFIVGLESDRFGNTYIIGYTNSEAFPTINPMNRLQGYYDVFLAKISSIGSLQFFQLFGGNSDDIPYDTNIGDDGTITIVGSTVSDDLPVTENSFQTEYNPSDSDGFIAQFTSSGDLSYCSYIGGSGYDEAFGVAVDQTGGIFIAGITSSEDFPILN
ncbi:MAG: SBBP repeat-containing protein, partial [Candidatus Thorarchaeota archaeon]|nr:SBBP repeat-containing protein [Candidatus Thorarchaeota archaeon]